MLIAVLGATYAFFQLDTNTESSNTTITGSTPPKSLVTLKQGTSNLHLNISASDMSVANATKEYYATDVEGKAYENNETDGTKTIASVELTGGEETTKYSCTTKLTVSKVTEEENADTMIEALQPGDMILQFKGNIISEKLDLSELKTTGSKEYNLKFKVTGNNPEEIQAYIKLVNKDKSQNYLAGKKLNIDINTTELKCEIFEPESPKPNIDILRANDSGKYLSTNLEGEMYRYQGLYTDEINNYICLGDNCCNTESCPYDSNDDMYRIIGITESGEIKVIKKTASGSSEYSAGREWPSSQPYAALQKYYSSLDSKLKEIIVTNHSWQYGSYDDVSANYSGFEAYDKETRWSFYDLVDAPVGLIYLSDYYFAYKTTYSDAGRPKSHENALNSWIHLNYNESTHPNNTKGSEGILGFDDSQYWIRIESGGYIKGTVGMSTAIRPSFFLSSDIKLTGEGSLSNPFRIPGVN